MQHSKQFLKHFFVGALLVISSPAFPGSKVLADNENHNYTYYANDPSKTLYGDGQIWPDSTNVSGGSVVQLPFLIDFGFGPQMPYFSASEYGSIDDLTIVAGPGYQPLDPSAYYFNSSSIGKVSPYSSNYSPLGNISQAAGLIDRSLVDSSPLTACNSPDSLTDGTSNGDLPACTAVDLQAYRFLWKNVCADDVDCSDDDKTSFEAVFVYLSSEAFILQYNYADGLYDSSAPGDGNQVCFANGREILPTVTNPITIAGCLAATNGSSVPEPPMGFLFLAGGYGIARTLRARRRRTTSLL